MLNKVIQWSIKNRLIVVVAAAILLGYGGVVAVRAPVDVFPDLTAPTVTILTESHGMAPEEVESLVSLPIESAMDGRAGAARVGPGRSRAPGQPADRIGDERNSRSLSGAIELCRRHLHRFCRVQSG